MQRRRAGGRRSGGSVKTRSPSPGDDEPVSSAITTFSQRFAQVIKFVSRRAMLSVGGSNPTSRIAAAAAVGRVLAGQPFV